MAKSGVRQFPPARRINEMATDLGIAVEVSSAREAYKRQGLTAKEARERVYVEKRLEERWRCWRVRKSQSTLLNSEVSLTPSELAKMKPGIHTATITTGATVGNEVLSLAEQIRWAAQQLARSRNEDAAPTEFPSADTLYWYQTAITRPGDFDKIVMRVGAPQADGNEVWMRDGEHQFAEIERQLREVRHEVGGELLAFEPEYSELVQPMGEHSEVKAP